jgi:hypothetical protein
VNVNIDLSQVLQVIDSIGGEALEEVKVPDVDADIEFEPVPLPKQVFIEFPTCE